MAATETVPTILQIAETGRAEDLREELLEKSNRSLYYFTKVVMNYRDLSDGFHCEVCDNIQVMESEQMAGYLMARGHFKSTIITKARILWKYLKNHEERFLIVGESDTVAKKNLIDIKWHIKNNQLLLWLYPELKALDGEAKWTEGEILLPRAGSYDEPTITCDGIGAKRTGFHYTEIVFDDVIGDKAAASEAVMDAAWEWIEYSRGLLHDPALSRRVWVGTRWKHGTGDVYGRIMVQMPGVKWYIRSAIENDQPVFPERFSLKTLAAIRQEEGDYKFNCQYMNNPTAPGGADFEASWIQEYEVDEDGITIKPCDGSPSVTTGQLLRMSFYDPSSGGKTANCENAITFAGMSSDRRIFILENWGENTSIGQSVEKWHLFNDRWNAYKNYYELVGAQKAVEDMCNERRHQPACPYCPAGHIDLAVGKYSRNPHRKLIPVGVSPEGGKLSKEERIRMYAQKAMEEKRVYLRRGMAKLRAQIVEFPHGPLVDRFDTVAYLIHLLRPPLSDADVESNKAEDAKHKAPVNQRTHTDVCYGGYV